MPKLSGIMTLGIATDIQNFFNGFWQLLLRCIYEIVVCTISRLADLCQVLFRKFAGISEKAMTVDTKTASNFGTFNQEDQDIIFNLISSQIVQRIFWALLALAIILLLMTTFVATIKTEFAQDGNNNKKKVIKNAFRGIFNFVAVPVISIFAIIVSNGLLKALDGATNPSGNQTYISSQIFLACGYNANRTRLSENNSDSAGLGFYQPGSFGELITKEYGNFGIFLDDDKNSGSYRAADKIDQAFANGLTINFGKETTVDLDMNGQSITVNLSADKNANTLYYGGRLSFWYGGKCVGWPASAHKKTGNNVAYGTTDNPSITFTMYDTNMVWYYYDLGAFDYIVFLVVGLYCAWVLIASAVGLIKRMFMLVTLFIISPPICAMYPMDGGAALGKWRSEFVKELLSAYSVVVVMNIYLALLPLFLKINVFATTDWAARLNQMFPYIASATSDGMLTTAAVNVLNYFARLFIIVGSLNFFKKANGIIAGFIGGGDAYGDGADVAKKSANQIIGGARLAAGLAGGAAGLGLKGARGLMKAPSMAMNAAAKRKEELSSEYEKSVGASADKSAGGSSPDAAQANVEPDTANAMNSKGDSDGGPATTSGSGSSAPKPPSGGGSGKSEKKSPWFDRFSGAVDKGAGFASNFLGKVNSGISNGMGNAFTKISAIASGDSKKINPVVPKFSETLNKTSGAAIKTVAEVTKAPLALGKSVRNLQVEQRRLKNNVADARAWGLVDNKDNKHHLKSTTLKQATKFANENQSTLKYRYQQSKLATDVKRQTGELQKQIKSLDADIKEYEKRIAGDKTNLKETEDADVKKRLKADIETAEKALKSAQKQREEISKEIEKYNQVRDRLKNLK